MNKYLLTLVTLVSISLAVQAQQTYALITGVSAYKNSEMNLNSTTKDAKDLKAVLDKLGVKSAILTSKYANNQNIADKLNKIVATAKENDKIMFFFSGHGSSGVFCTYDDLFKYSDLVAILSKAKAREIYCFVDACMSGSVITSSDGYSWADNKNMTFMMGCRAEEFSYESAWVGHGFFTKSLLKALRGKAAKDGIMTVESLFNYIYKDVTAHTRQYEQIQHPQLIGPRSMFGNVLFKYQSKVARQK